MNNVEAIILAGGKSTRMGTDKGELLLGEKTLLEHVEGALASADLRVHLIEEDLVPACGPLSGIVTGFMISDATRLLFLSCDMPFVKTETISRLANSTDLLFAHSESGFGFPFVLTREEEPEVRSQIESGHRSIQALANRINPTPFSPSNPDEFFNVNTPADLDRARQLL